MQTELPGIEAPPPVIDPITGMPRIGSVWFHRQKGYRVFVLAVAPAGRGWIVCRHYDVDFAIEDQRSMRLVFTRQEWMLEMQCYTAIRVQL